MVTNRVFALIFFILFLYAEMASQNPIQIIDSLKTQLAHTSLANNRAKILADLTWYYSMVNTDSAYGRCLSLFPLLYVNCPILPKILKMYF